MRLPAASTLVLIAFLFPGRRLAAQDPAWHLSPARSARALATFRDTSLHESSGVAASRRQPGVLWTIEDSGAEPVLHATDTTGANLGTWRVTGASNVDWEALAIGPCPAGSCLYIGDTGDNAARRHHATIYRVAEPDIGTHGGGSAPAHAVRIAYPGGPVDVEAMLVQPSGALLLVSKVRRTPPHLYRVPAEGWQARGVIRASDLGALPLPSGSLATRVTDAALSPDGRTVAVRTYTAIYFFVLSPGGQLRPVVGRPACGIFGIEPQGEGVDWLDAATLVTTSEDNFGMRGGISLVQCNFSLE